MAGFVLRALRRLPSALAPLLETRCVSCSVPVPPGSSTLCAPCAAALARREGGFCPMCGNLTATQDEIPALCGDCLTASRPWERFIFHGAYSGLLRDLILRFKQGRELPLGCLLGGFLADHPAIGGPYDAIVPVPLHPARLRERGFNQSLELAAPLAERLGTPVLRRALVRRVRTRSQAGLNRTERGNNVRNVFEATSRVRGGRLLLVDDVATTCASLESTAKTLLDAGAAAVTVAVVARTPGLIA